MNHKASLATMALATLALTGCVANDAEGSDAIAVTSSADACTVETDEATSGNVTFDVENTGDKVTEFYILAEDGLSIVGEVENISPGVSRSLTVQAQPGSYFTVCKPGMVGKGVDQTPFTVTGDAVEIDPEDEAEIQAAVDSYTAYTKTQAAELVEGVAAFTAAYKAGDDDEARRLYPLSRINYERIEPTAAQFGDLDPKIDYRKPGAEAEGLEFTGFHRIEMDLWISEARKNYPDEKIAPLDQAGRDKVADQLVTNVGELYEKVHADDFVLSLADITNGAIGLLDEVAAPDGKLPGEEDEFSHTDLYDFYANVEGAEVAYTAVRDLAVAKGAEALVAELDTEFAAMKKLLDTYGSYEKGYVSYDTVQQPERNKLAAQLNALSEPLSQITGAVLGLESE
ncbi:peptidase M75 family protein [Nocardioides sp. zg-536]|uniref:Peptidase M75 family protein n=1 Tax=Nocardioides faecalis TaxID=2803858 RepID=A0A939BWL5_9ACTN|nr:iron uptake system protein EfeO [Nocardioides faecalis]MBM9460767.1 peptidase M75 family protein [Nocardioides faecalis]MBS4752706.1 peptidase M75 family protein [Nocardioides faecalis]QVI57960.1 peptidase M75 family protein [Nocardioides faecalis]